MESTNMGVLTGVAGSGSGFFSTILSVLENAPAEINAATTIVGGVETTVETLLQNPAVLALENLFGANFTVTTTPGAAAVVEPAQHSK
jgi:hypothetical protein